MNEQKMLDGQVRQWEDEVGDEIGLIATCYQSWRIDEKSRRV